MIGGGGVSILMAYPSAFYCPEDFRRTVSETFGVAGAAWLERLPQLIAVCERRWSLTALPPYNLSYNYVAPVLRTDGSRVELKLGVPNPELVTEIAALRLYQGRGITQLLEVDEEQGILLLECLLPGEPLSDMEDDEQATLIAAGVMQRLWRPVPAEHPFPTAARWQAGIQRHRTRFQGSSGPLSSRLVELAEGLQEELLATSTEAVLLHGDLHHDNILSAACEPWLAVDPKGVVGEPAYEVGPLFFNPPSRMAAFPNLKRTLSRRVDLLTETLGFDRQRLIGWGIARAVLSACWSIEDQGYGGEEVMTVAGLLAEMLG